MESAETSLDKAHVTVERDTDSVTSAQNAYNSAVEKYGASSQRAVDAHAKLETAEDALNVAQQRVGEAQNNVNQTIMMSTLTIIPSCIGMVGSLSQVMAAYPAVAGAVSSATEAVGTAMDFLAANPIILVIMGIAALAIGLYEAYEHCAPFRDAINEVGNVLEGAFKTALTDIENALSTLGATCVIFGTVFLCRLLTFLRVLLLRQLIL